MKIRTYPKAEYVWTVEKIAVLREQKNSYEKIAQLLNKLGHRTRRGRPWTTATTFLAFKKSKFYMGEMVSNHQRKFLRELAALNKTANQIVKDMESRNRTPQPVSSDSEYMDGAPG